MNKGRTPKLACGPFLFFLLCSCGSHDDTPTPQENAQLANSDALLNSAPDTLSNIDGNMLGPAHADPQHANQ